MFDFGFDCDYLEYIHIMYVYFLLLLFDLRLANININTVILPKDIQAAPKGGFLFHKTPSRAMARGHT